MNMNITPITDRLFLVESIVPQELVNQISEIDWDKLPMHIPDPEVPRLQLLGYTNPVLRQVDVGLANNFSYIESKLGVSFDSKIPGSNWWLDGPGTMFPIHTDGNLVSSMQLYWYGATEDYGTVFYNSKNPDDILYKFKFTTNSGYIMLNQLNEDGSQPLQWHGMLNTVPDGMYRLSSYTYFGTYKTK